MIICLSGFVIAGTSPTSPPLLAAPLSARNEISILERVSVTGAAGAAGGGARYSPHHHQLLQQFGAGVGAGAGAARSSSSSAESVSSPSGSPPPQPAGGAGGAGRRVRTLYACLGESEGELSFEPNQIISSVAPSGEPGWLRGELHGRRGLVPENYVEPLP